MECTHNKAPWPRSRFATRQGRTDVGGEFVDTHLRSARRHSRGHLSHDGAIADSVGLDRRERQEPHRDLHHPGHGDHFFGLASLLERFPRARAVATPEVVKAMHEHLSPDRIENFWRRLFPGEILDRLLVAESLEDEELELEGHKLVAVNAGRTDTAHSTCLYVPSIGLIVGGDAVYNGIHP